MKEVNAVEDKVTEYKFNNITVRMHGAPTENGQPDRKRLEDACVDFMRKALSAEANAIKGV